MLKKMEYPGYLDSNFADFGKMGLIRFIAGGSRYPLELVQVCASWPRHHNCSKRNRFTAIGLDPISNLRLGNFQLWCFSVRIDFVSSDTIGVFFLIESADQTKSMFALML